MKQKNVMYCWDVIEHLAARQIRSIVDGDAALNLFVVTQSVADDLFVHEELAHSRVKIFHPIKRIPFPRIQYGSIFLLILLLEKIDVVDVKMAQSFEAKWVNILCRCFKKKYIINMLGRERHIYDDGHFLPEEKTRIVKIVREASAAVCVDQTLVDLAIELREGSLGVYKLFNAQNLIDVSAFDKIKICEHLRIDFLQKIVLFNHRLLPSKRVEVFFDVVEDILSERIDISFVVVSTNKDHDLSTRLSLLCQKYPRNIYWFGRIKRLSFDQLCEIYSIADLGINIATLVVPSLATLEGMAAGIPQVISNEIDSDKYVCDGWNGLIVDGDNRKEIKKAMYRILDDDKLRFEMRQNCLKKVSAFFDQRSWADAMRGIYNDVCLLT